MTSPSAVRSDRDRDRDATTAGPEILRAGFFSIFLPTQVCAPGDFAIRGVRRAVGKIACGFAGFSTLSGIIAGLTSPKSVPGRAIRPPSDLTATRRWCNSQCADFWKRERSRPIHSSRRSIQFDYRHRSTGPDDPRRQRSRPHLITDASAGRVGLESRVRPPVQVSVGINWPTRVLGHQTCW